MKLFISKMFKPNSNIYEILDEVKGTRLLPFLRTARRKERERFP